jgi:hypothetical protein
MSRSRISVPRSNNCNKAKTEFSKVYRNYKNCKVYRNLQKYKVYKNLQIVQSLQKFTKNTKFAKITNIALFFSDGEVADNLFGI